MMEHPQGKEAYRALGRKPKLLDLYSGSGGGAVGYRHAGFEVVGIDIAPMPDYPFEFHQGDAIEYLNAHWRDFAAVHASAPCQKYTRINHGAKDRLLDLVGPTREALKASGLPYIIENVVGAPLINPIMLCGTMFDGLRVIRHRLFESNVLLFAPGPCWHKGSVADGTYVSPHGGGVRSTHTISYADQRARWEDAMGVHWIRRRSDLCQIIPPAYTAYLGAQLLDAVLNGRVAASDTHG